MGKSLGRSRCLAAALVVASAPALSQSSMYFDYNGATAGSGVKAGGVGFFWTTSGNPLWTTSSAGTSATQDWLNGWRAVIAAGADCIGFGVGASLAGGSSAPSVAGYRLEDCNSQIYNNVLFLTGNPSDLDVQGAALELTISAGLSWPSGGVIRKLGPGSLLFTGGTSDGGTPSSTVFEVQNGQVQLGSGVATNWFGGSSNSAVTIGTGGQSASLTLGASDQLRDSTVVNVVNGTFSIGGFGETIRGLTGTGTVTGDGSLLSIHNTGSTNSFSGGIVDGSSPLSLSVSGGGEQVLSGTSSFSGITTVTGNGRLVVDGSLSASNVEVVDGELVSVASQFADVLLTANGEVELAIGSSGFGNLDWEGGGRMIWILGPTASAADSSTLQLASLSRSGTGALVIAVDPASQIPLQGQSYGLIDFGATTLSPGDFAVEAGPALQDRNVLVRVEAGMLWLDISARDPVFEDGFEAVAP